MNTTDLIKAALARGLELPADWFKPKCSKCGWKLGHFMRCADPCCAADESRKSGDRFLYPPDLTAPANLYELLRFADAIGEAPCDVFSFCIKGAKHFTADVFPKWVKECVTANGPDRSTAILAACAKALNIEDTPNANP